MEKGWCVGVVEAEEVRRDDPVIYFHPVGGQKYLLSPRGVMASEVPKMKRFLEEAEKELVLPSVREERIKELYVLRNECEEGLFGEMLTAL